MSMDPYNEQRLRDEVIYLHSLWHQGPPRLNPYPNPNHTTSTHLLPPSNPPQFKKPNKRPKRANKTPPQSDLEWPCKETPVDPSPSGWPARTLITRVVLSPEEQAQFAATRIQNKAVTALEGFFAENLDSDGEGSDEDEEMGGDGYEEYQFFLKLFEEEELRGYCEKNWEGGDFVCLVCSGIGKRKKFKNCVAVVQHSVTVARTKKKKAHRAYAQVLCRVLGWDIDRLPTIDSSLAKPIDSQGNAEVAIGESSMINKDSTLENVDSGEIIQKEVPNVDKEEELLSSSVPGTSTVIGDNVMPCENSLKDGDANKCVENIGSGNTGVTTCLAHLDQTLTLTLITPPQPTSSHRPIPPNSRNPTKPGPKDTRANKTPPQSDLEWPCKETLVDPSPSGWPAPTLITQVGLSPEEQAQFAATQIQNKAITALEGFFAGNLDTDGEGSDEDDVMGGDGYEEYQFFLKLFEEVEELRGYCEKNWEGGDFVCLVCSRIGKRKRFKNCVAVVQRSVTIVRTKKKKAHRAYAQVLCRVLGWDIDWLPTIVSSSAKPIESRGNAEVAIGESSMINKDSALENADNGEIIQKEVTDVDKEEELLSSSVPGTSTVTGDNVMPCENSLKDGDANKCVENIDNGVQSFGDGNTGVATGLEHREVSVDNGHEIRDNEKGIVVVNDLKENYRKAN
ncbi:hypothetical protein Vadar_024204 [Vaccinium darrowii]|uniref:Uncharacterized protein n=1 Tax=Vaccinium darrowii TaxID=229202 RepID=A0ACB7XSR0_9ERIC|nr:hypothetical protein Vadar_024204 [Vaccinium darrowii]